MKCVKGLFTVLLLTTLFGLSAAQKLNLLLLLVDDLTSLLGYNGDNVYTPNIDALAKRSLIFEQQHCAFPVCNPSRTSFLTSRRPDTTHAIDNDIYWRRDTPGNFTSLPQFLKENGYVTRAFGKIYHTGMPGTPEHDYPYSWSKPAFIPVEYWERNFEKSWRALTPQEHRQKPTTDAQTADAAIDFINNELDVNNPFFLAVGFHKPHTPFIAPEEDYAHYPDNFTLPESSYLINQMPRIAWWPYNGLRLYDDVLELGVTGDFNTSIPDPKVRELRRAYYSCITFSDRQLGRVVDALNQKGALENTVIAFVGDHGFHIGEHLQWLKNSLYERSTRAPSFISVPGLTDQGLRTSALTEHLDLFPTLVELLGFPPLPKCPIENPGSEKLCTEGQSLTSLFLNPEVDVKEEVYTQIYREEQKQMGYSIRTKLYRYVEWFNYDIANFKPIWSSLFAKELYDLQVDPAEDFNVVRLLQYEQVVAKLSAQLKEKFDKQ